MTDVQRWRRRFGIVACAVFGVAAPAVALAMPDRDQPAPGHDSDSHAQRDVRAEPAPAHSRAQHASVMASETESPLKLDDPTWPDLALPAKSYRVEVAVTNPGTEPAKLAGWVDFDRNGQLDDGKATAVISAGAERHTATLTWTGLSGLQPGKAIARLRSGSDSLDDSAVTILPKPEDDCRADGGARTPAAELPDEYGPIHDWAEHPSDGRRYAVNDLGSLVRWDPERQRYGSTYPNAVLPKGDYRDVGFDAAGNLYAMDAGQPTTARQLDLRSSTETEPIRLDAVDWGRSLGTDGIADCAPAFDFGDAPGGYPTAPEAGGPSHRSDQRLTLGEASSSEPAAVIAGGGGSHRGCERGCGGRPPQASTAVASGDDDDALDDAPSVEPYATRYSVEVPYRNQLGGPVTVAGWLDANLDGRFTTDERHVAHLRPDDPAPELSWPVPGVRPNGTSYLRLRMYEGRVDDPSPAGAVDGRGEVEDHSIRMRSAPVSDFYVEALEASAAAGGPGTLPLVIGNAGPSDAELDVMVNVDPPAHVSFGAPPSNCTHNLDGTVKCRLSADLLPANGDPIALQLPFAVDSAAPPNARLTGGTVEVDTTRDPKQGNNRAELDISTAAASSDTSVRVRPVDRAVSPGEPAVVSVRVGNAGPSDTAETGTLELTTPEGSAPAKRLPPGCEASGPDQISCAVRPGLVTGSVRTYDIPVRPDPDLRSASTLQGGEVELRLATDPATGDNQATFQLRTREPVADVSVSTTPENDRRIAPGSVFPHRVRVTNHGPSDAEAVELSHRIPAALAFEPTADVPGCTVTGRELSCAATDLPAGESIEHWLPVRLAPAYGGDGSDLVDDADVFTATPDPVPANNTRNSNLPGLGVGNGRADLRISVTPPANGITPGTVDTMTMTARNLGPSTSSGRGYAELRLPRSTSATRRALPGDCERGTDHAVVRCRIPEGMRPGTEHHWRIRIQATPDVPAADRYEGGHAEMTDAESPTGRLRFGIPASQPTADLVMAKRPASDRPVRPGESFGYELTVINSGPSNARNIVVRDRLPRPLSFRSSKHGCEATVDGRVVCPAIEELRAGHSRTLVVNVELARGYRGDGRNIANRAVVSSDTEDLDEANNSSEFSTSGMPGGVVTHPPADLSVSVESSGRGRPIAPGETVEYRLTVVNAGPSNAVHTTISGLLPAPLRMVATPDGCEAFGQRFECAPLESLADGDRVQRRFAVRLDPRYAGDGSDLAVLGRARSYSADPDRSDNSVASYR